MYDIKTRIKYHFSASSPIRVKKTNIRSRACIFLALFCIFSSVPLLAQDTLVLIKGTESYDLTGRYLSYFEDPDKNLTIENIITPEYQKKFKHDIKDVPNFGYTTSAYWLKFIIHSNDATNGWLLSINYALIDYISIYIQSKDTYIEKKNGHALPFSIREIKNENIVFTLDLPPNTVSTCYLRIVSQDSLALPMILSSYKAFSDRNTFIRLFLGICYGFIIVMILYNLFIFIVARDLNYLFLVLYLASFMIFIMSESGIAYQYLWPEFPWWAKRAVPFSIGMVEIWSSLFARLFLNTKNLDKRLDKVILVFFGIGIAITGLSMSIDYLIAVILAVVIIVLYAPVLIITAFISWRKGYRPALSYLVAWFAIIIGTIMYGFKALGFVPETIFVKHSVLIGAAFQSIMLSIAMADRINMMTMSLRTMKNNLEKRTESLLKIFEKAETMANKLSDVSAEQSEVVETFSHVAQNQATHAEEMSATYEELTSSTDSIDTSMSRLASEGEKIRDMAQVLTTTQSEVKDTNDAVLDSMKNIILFTEKTDADLTHMTDMMQIINEGSKAITNIISMIDDISDKINLLSLNASIEAARAGDHGRGFAVVADEIGKLATATTDNSKQISSQIEKISVDIRKGIEIANLTKKSTGDVARQVAGINSQIDTVKTAMAKQEKAIDQLVGQADVINEQSRIISVATTEQKTGMMEGTVTIQSLANMATEIAMSNIKILEFIKVLNDKAKELRELVQKLDEAETTA